MEMKEVPFKVDLGETEKEIEELGEINLPAFSFTGIPELDCDVWGIDGGRAVVDGEKGSLGIVVVAKVGKRKEKKGWGIFSPSQGESSAFKGASLLSEPLAGSEEEGIVFMDGSASTFTVSLASALFSLDSEPPLVREFFFGKLRKGTEALLSLWGRAVFCPKIVRKRHLVAYLEKSKGIKIPYSDLYTADKILKEGTYFSLKAGEVEGRDIKWPDKVFFPYKEELEEKLRERKVVFFKRKGFTYKVELWGVEEEVFFGLVDYFHNGKNLLTSLADKEAKEGVQLEVSINEKIVR